MSYRPYPNADRALRQLDRHTRPATPVPAALRAFDEGFAQLRENTRNRAPVQLFPVGEYRLWTRRPA